MALMTAAAAAAAPLVLVSGGRILSWPELMQAPADNLKQNEQIVLQLF